MGKPPEDSSRLDPFSDSSFEASARALDAYLTMSASAHKLFTQFMGQILGQLNMPTQGEVLSVAERLTNIEMRLDDLDALLGEMAHNIEAIARTLTSESRTGSGSSKKDRAAPETVNTTRQAAAGVPEPKKLGSTPSKGSRRRGAGVVGE